MEGLVDRFRGALGEELWHLAGSLNRDYVLQLVEEHSWRDRYYAVTFMPLYSTQEPSALLIHYAAMLNGLRLRTNEQCSTLVIELSAEDSVGGYAAIVPSALDSVWMLVTDMKRDDQHRLIDPLLSLLSSKIASAWLSNTEIQELLTGVEDATGVYLKAGRVSCVGRDRSVVEFHHEATLRDVFTEVREQGRVIRSIEFSGSSRVGFVHGNIDKWLRITYKQGRTAVLEQFLLARIESLLQRHVLRLQVRRDEALAGRPITFCFADDVLTDRPNNQALVNTIGSLPRVSVNAFHINPYLHVSVVDLTDGSTMDLFADDPATLSVIPGKRCSVSAVSRVFDQVYNHFALGEIVAPPNIQVGGEAQVW